MHKALPLRNNIDRPYMSKKKEEEKYSPALKIGKTQQFSDSKNIFKKRVKKGWLQQTVTAIIFVN